MEERLIQKLISEDDIETFVKDFLPFKIKKTKFNNIRGNILTRFNKFIESDSDGFVVAKAAIDRLLNSDKKYFPDIENILRKQINQCLWNIVPLSVNPSSPGQGALAIEIRADDSELKHLLKDLNNKIDYENVILEREELRKYGGGCHQKIGVSFQNTFFGKINNEAISPNKMKYIKYFKVCSQPTAPRVYCVNKGAKKYPTEAAAVTMPVATVLFSLGKCLPTSETGTLIAVAPSAVPTKTPKLI